MGTRTHHRSRRSGPGAVQLACPACGRVIRVVDDRTNVLVMESIRHTAAVAVVPLPVPPVEGPVASRSAEVWGQAVGRAFEEAARKAATPDRYACSCGAPPLLLTVSEVVELVIDAQDRGVRRVPLVARTVAQDR